MGGSGGEMVRGGPGDIYKPRRREAACKELGGRGGI